MPPGVPRDYGVEADTMKMAGGGFAEQVTISTLGGNPVSCGAAAAAQADEALTRLEQAMATVA